MSIFNLFSRKWLIALVFIVIGFLFAFVINSPVDGMKVIESANFWLVLTTALGITIPLKLIQKAVLGTGYKVPQYVSYITQFWKMLDASSGFVFAVVSFIFASILLYYRVSVMNFEIWLGYHVIIMALYDSTNIVRKAMAK